MPYLSGANDLCEYLPKTDSDAHLMFLERVDTSIDLHQLHIVWKITADHQLLPAYGEYPFESPEHDVQVWEKQ